MFLRSGAFDTHCGDAGIQESPLAQIVESLAVGKFEAGPQRLDVSGCPDLGAGLGWGTSMGCWWSLII